MDFLKKLHNFKPLPDSVEFEGITINPTDQYCIAGGKNSGKSYFATALCLEMETVIIWDSRWERFTAKDKRAKSDKALEMPPDWVTAYSPEELRILLYRGKKHIIYHPLPLKRGSRSKDDFIDEFDSVCEIVFEWKDIFFMVDEADNVCNPTTISDSFFNILEYGKHSSIGLIACTRRFQHLNPRLSRLASGLFIFRVSAKDFKYIYEYLPSDEYDDDGDVNRFEKASEIGGNYEQTAKKTYERSYEKRLRKELTQQEDRYFHYFDGRKITAYEPIEEVL